MSKYVATIEGFGKNKQKTIEKVTVIDNTPVRLNNKFQISELKHTVINSFSDAEIIDENDDSEFDLNGFSKGFNSALKDRF